MNTRPRTARRVRTQALSLLCAIILLWGASPSLDAQTRTTSTRRTNSTRRTTPRRSATTATGAQRAPTPVSVPSLKSRGATAQTASPAAGSASIVVPSLSAEQQQQPQPSPTTAPQSAPTPPAVRNEEAAEDDEDEVIRVTSNLVVVPTSVTNAAGEPVSGLRREDFRLEEEGRAQEIREVGTAEQVPLDIVIIFDASSSTTARKFYDFQQEAAARFLKQVLKATDRAAVFTLSDKPRLEQALASAEIASARLGSIPAAKTPVPTAFYDTVISAARYLAQNAPGRHRRVILSISDGEDNFSNIIRETSRAEARGEVDRATSIKRQRTLHERALKEVQREVQRADSVFYSINPTGPGFRLNEISTRAQVGMQQIAEATGGTAFVPENTSRLDAVFRQIANELRAQYLLQYHSNSGAAPGKYLSIKVRTPGHGDARVRARQGYYVPQPK